MKCLKWLLLSSGSITISTCYYNIWHISGVVKYTNRQCLHTNSCYKKNYIPVIQKASNLNDVQYLIINKGAAAIRKQAIKMLYNIKTLSTTEQSSLNIMCMTAMLPLTMATRAKHISRINCCCLGNMLLEVSHFLVWQSSWKSGHLLG